MTYGELLEADLEQSPELAADWLRELAGELEDGDELTVSTGDDSVTVELPTDTLEFEVEIEREAKDDDRDEIELEWLVASAESDGETEE